jgi:hypothetical protein
MSTEYIFKKFSEISILTNKFTLKPLCPHGVIYLILLVYVYIFIIVWVRTIVTPALNFHIMCMQVGKYEYMFRGLFNMSIIHTALTLENQCSAKLWLVSRNFTASATAFLRLVTSWFIFEIFWTFLMSISMSCRSLNT